jgi:dolichol-phosphate hexosyltransferase
MRKSIFNKVDVKARSLEFETKMTMRAAKLGYKIRNVQIDYRVRVGTSKQKPLTDGYRMLKAIPTIFWEDSSTVLKVSIIINFALILVGSFFGIITLYDRIVHGDILHYYYPLITVLTIILAIQLISFTLLIDYVTNKLNRIEDKINTV